MIERIKELSEKYFSRVVELRRQIHANPELSWEEFQTSNLVAEELTKLGIEVKPLAKTGIIGILKGKNPDKKCIALRADMDALPIQELNKVDYCSKNAGKMHGCGHDVHTANLLGAAMILSELKNDFEGTIKFIFQPSEEKIPSGAEAMTAAGALENPKVDRILGLHVSPEIEAGKFGFCGGRFMASSDEIHLTVIGKGGHAAQPRNVINPLLMAAEILLAFKDVTDLSVPVVLAFGNIEGKGATNIIPDRVKIDGTLRCFDETLRYQVHEKIKSQAEIVAMKNGGLCEVNIMIGYPVLINDDALTEKAKALTTEYSGAENMLEIPVRMGSEDFAYYTHHVPACFYRLGVGNFSKGITSSIHTPTFNIDEDALKGSIGLMSWLAIN
ncbi:MAG: N-acyl-L-amino acid amidohydrolase [Bacteroidota bacterium]|nr:N-acyl-L-amino acid amidohydrolase [Bacteroidota bacterium]